MYVTRHRAEVVDFTDPFMNIHATILIKRPRTGKPTPIHTVEQLVDQHTIRYGTVRTGIIVRSFRTSNTSISRLTWEKIKAFRPTTFTQTNEEGIHKVRTSNGRYAFILPDTIGSYMWRNHGGWVSHGPGVCSGQPERLWFSEPAELNCHLPQNKWLHEEAQRQVVGERERL